MANLFLPTQKSSKLLVIKTEKWIYIFAFLLDNSLDFATVAALAKVLPHELLSEFFPEKSNGQNGRKSFLCMENGDYTG